MAEQRGLGNEGWGTKAGLVLLFILLEAILVCFSCRVSPLFFSFGALLLATVVSRNNFSLGIVIFFQNSHTHKNKANSMQICKI